MDFLTTKDRYPEIGDRVSMLSQSFTWDVSMFAGNGRFAVSRGDTTCWVNPSRMDQWIYHYRVDGGPIDKEGEGDAENH